MIIFLRSLTCLPQILEGLATVIASLISASILPSDISSAKFLTDEERAFACALEISLSRGFHTEAIM